MDLNELLHARQLEVMKATACQDERQRETHFSVVARYAEEIRKLRKILPETTAVQFPATGSIPSYARDDHLRNLRRKLCTRTAVDRLGRCVRICRERANSRLCPSIRGQFPAQPLGLGPLAIHRRYHDGQRREKIEQRSSQAQDERLTAKSETGGGEGSREHAEQLIEAGVTGFHLSDRESEIKRRTSRAGVRFAASLPLE